MAMLVFNAGSSSIKFALFDAALQRTVSGLATEIGGAGQLEIGGTTSAGPLRRPCRSASGHSRRTARKRHPAGRPRRRGAPRRPWRLSTGRAEPPDAGCHCRDRGLHPARPAAQSAQSRAGPRRRAVGAGTAAIRQFRHGLPHDQSGCRDPLRHPAGASTTAASAATASTAFPIPAWSSSFRHQRRAAAAASAGAASGQRRQPLRHSRRPLGRHHHGLLAARRPDHGHALGRHRRQRGASPCSRTRHRGRLAHPQSRERAEGPGRRFRHARAARKRRPARPNSPSPISATGRSAMPAR